jgi:hypothetical protein
MKEIVRGKDIAICDDGNRLLLTDDVVERLIFLFARLSKGVTNRKSRTDILLPAEDVEYLLLDLDMLLRIEIKITAYPR